MGERRLRDLVGVAVLLGLAASGGYFLGARGRDDAAVGSMSGVATTPTPGEVDSRDAVIEQLRLDLASQLEARVLLEQKLEELREDALALAAAYREEFGEDELDESASEDGDTASASPAATADRDLGRPAHELPAAKPRPKGVSVSALLAAGFGEVEAERIRERIEDIAMRQLYLANTAEREGWKKTTRFNKAYRAIGAEFQQMRDEYGDERFDWILYASGRKNRVVVDSVFSESAAGEAGLQPGDFILSYADDRIFNGRELREATLGGDAGNLVVLEYERKGVSHRVYVPRGPVGVQLHDAALPPGSS